MPQGSYLETFKQAKSLRTLITPVMSFMCGIFEVEKTQDNVISRRMQGILQSCPKLSHVIGTASNGLPDMHVSRQGVFVADLSQRNVSWDVSLDLRFWVLPKRIDVCQSHRNTCCGMYKLHPAV